jgi:hypothetical protein
LTHRSWLVIGAIALAACGTTSRTSMAQSSTTPAASAEAAVQGFMRAVADSNLAKMAELWGSAKGPAAKTKQPDDYERRIVVMQLYLRQSPYRILSNAQDGSNAARRILQVELQRKECAKLVPFTVVRAGTGAWLVNSIDLVAAGTPGANCKEDDKEG